MGDERAGAAASMAAAVWVGPMYVWVSDNAAACCAVLSVLLRLRRRLWQRSSVCASWGGRGSRARPFIIGELC